MEVQDLVAQEQVAGACDPSLLTPSLPLEVYLSRRRSSSWRSSVEDVRGPGWLILSGSIAGHTLTNKELQTFKRRGRLELLPLSLSVITCGPLPATIGGQDRGFGLSCSPRRMQV